MIRSYLNFFFRNTQRRKVHTGINVLCLTVGITFSLVIGLFIREEMSVNQNLKDVDRLFLVENIINEQKSKLDFFSPPALTRSAVDQYPGVFENQYRFWDRNITLSRGEKHFRIQSMIGDESFLSMFGFKILHGDKHSALKNPGSLVVTEEVAMKFFGRTDVVGESIDVSTERNGIKAYQVTAVIAEPDQKNSVSDFMDMNAQAFFSLENSNDFLAIPPDGWDNGIISYVKLTSSTSEAHAEKILNGIVQSQAPKTIFENRRVELSGLKDYYLLTNHGAVIKLLLSLTAVVIFILLLAVSNFLNISIATSMERNKEVGVRKVIGGSRQQLIVQFLFESVFLATLSAVVAVLMYEGSRPLFTDLLNAKLPSIDEVAVEIWLIFFASVTVLGLLAGAYPAFFQSAVKPVNALKGKQQSIGKAINFSRVLIAVQFVITIFVFTASIVLWRQTNFFLEGDLGYDKSNVLIISSVPRWWNEEGLAKMEAAKREFNRSADVESVSLSWGAPGLGIAGFESNMYKSGALQESGIKTFVTGVDEQFDEVYGLKMVEGIFLIGGQGVHVPGNIVLNETAAKTLKAEVGQKVKLNVDSVEYTVVGIVQDFNYESLYEPIKPVVLMHPADFRSYRFFSFRMTEGNPSQLVERAEDLWRTVFPDEAFTYHFADERLEALYATEIQLKKAASLGSVLMLIMVATGLLGIVSLNVSKRRKEIGIRKVLGASVLKILVMLSKEYSILIVVSVCFAIPCAFYFAHVWLQNFVYHADLSWWIFLLPSIALLFVTLAIVSIQSFKTATANPVDSLRQE